MKRFYSIVLLSLWAIAFTHCQFESVHTHSERSSKERHSSNQGHHHHHNRSDDPNNSHNESNDESPCELRDLSSNHIERISYLFNLINAYSENGDLPATFAFQYVYSDNTLGQNCNLDPPNLFNRAGLSLTNLSNAPPITLTLI